MFQEINTCSDYIFSESN